MTWRLICVIVGVLICAWRFGTATFAAEQIRANGEVVFIRLAPVDPRSLMLGDYMILGYDNAALPQPDFDATRERSGTAVVSLTSGDVQFVRDYAGGALADGERLMNYRRGPDGAASYGGEAYYFQSGTGDRFADAAYGVFRIMPDGRTLLSALADADKAIIVTAGEGPVRESDTSRDEP